MINNSEKNGININKIYFIEYRASRSDAKKIGSSELFLKRLKKFTMGIYKFITREIEIMGKIMSKKFKTSVDYTCLSGTIFRKQNSTTRGKHLI